MDAMARIIPPPCWVIYFPADWVDRNTPVRFMSTMRHRSAVELAEQQERISHAFTGSFTSDVYGGQPEWNENLDTARKAGSAIAQAVQKAKAETETVTCASRTDEKLRILTVLLQSMEMAYRLKICKPLIVKQIFGCGGRI